MNGGTLTRDLKTEALLTFTDGDRIYYRAMYFSSMIQTKGSDYIDEHRKEIEKGFEIYYTEQKRIKNIKERILAPLKSLLPAEPYKIVERIVRGLDMPSGELEKLILNPSSIDIK